jgi:SAM-dependent methyltransferase
MAERVRARVFGEVADEYDRIRPGYPAALVDDVLRYADLRGAPALEVGAGTGKATAAFAERGVTVTALEPDAAMAAVLRRRVAGRPNVTVTVSSFEEYRPRRPFGLLYSAQAWHWIDPAVRWRRAAAALAPGGALALFWNHDRPADPHVMATVVAAHERYAPQVAREMRPDVAPMTRFELAASWPRTDLETLREFGALSETVYEWQRTLSTADYVACLSTHSAHRLLDDAVRARLFDAILDRLGERITLSVETSLYLARRREVVVPAG